MKVIVFSAFVLLAGVAQAGTLQSIISDFEDANVEVQSSDLIGGYEGQCFEGVDHRFEQKEALYIGVFKNAAGEKVLLPLATEHLYNNYSQPKFVTKYLDTGKSKNWTKIGQVTRLGLSGTDNNLGSVTTGEDFKYLYKATAAANSLTLEVGQHELCQRGTGQFCPPPVLPACRHGHTATGYAFEGCVLSNDTTVFKRISATELVSKRTSDGWDLGPNLLTPDIVGQSYCRWTLKTPKAKVPAQFRGE